jgi:hypothetical protein
VCFDNTGFFGYRLPEDGVRLDSVLVSLRFHFLYISFPHLLRFALYNTSLLAGPWHLVLLSSFSELTAPLIDKLVGGTRHGIYYAM